MASLRIFPLADTYYDANCLTEIAAYLTMLMADRKKESDT